MSWIYLVLAGLCEIGWPLGFKLSQTPGTGPGKFAACIACSVFSMVRILWFGDSSNIWRMLAASFLLIGIIGLKLAPGH